MRFLHISDLHLGKNFSQTKYGREFAALRHRELFLSFANLIDYANRNGVDFILCAGDFLHGEDLTVEELRQINSILSRLERGRLILISGNHDPQGEQDPYRKIGWSQRLYLCPPGFGRLALPQFGAVIHYHSWETKEISQRLLQSLPPPEAGQYNILLLHGDCVGAGGESRYLPFSPEELSGFDYAALGHIHKPGRVGENGWYSGSLEPLDFGEDGTHGFVLVEAEGGRLRSQFIPFALREYRELAVEVGPQDSLLDISDRIARELTARDSAHIYRVTLEGRHDPRAPLSPEELARDLTGKEYHCWVEDHTLPDYDPYQLYLQNRGNLLGAFLGSFLGENQEERQLDQLSPVERQALEYGVEILLAQKEGSQWQR